MADAFTRISNDELGKSYDLNQATLLGVFEHFYDDSIFGSTLSTHYINAPHCLKVTTDDLNLPIGEQHINYRWLKLSEVESDISVHRFSKVFLPSLLDTMAM